MSTNNVLLGAHMSIAGGVEKAIYSGASIGCTAIQIFTDSNRRWARKALTNDEITRFREAQKETGLHHVIAHASYLINMSSTSSEIVKKSAQAVLEELNNCQALGIKYLVLHPGSGRPIEECLQKIAAMIDQVFDTFSGQVMLLYENTAGQGNVIGYTFEQLGALRNLSRHKRKIGFCFDTCHAWASGYDFSTAKAYDAMWQEFDKVIGISHLKAIHINNASKKLGSHVDRHAHIAQGLIPMEAFSLIMNDTRFIAVPKILETPKTDGLRGYIQDMEVLRGLLK